METKLKNKCDIIIPVYNAYEFVVKCVESLLENTNFDDNKIILINDASPDVRIKPLLKEFSMRYSFIEVFENEQNLGFVGTVNRGMKYSKNNVVLLNSDTEVTAKWLDKIKLCAETNKKVATVTPLSNNATLVSVPIPFEVNDIPKGYTVEEYGKIIEECSLNEYPEIPTGHGFCMFINRNVIDEVGYFDEESFGKGYGEENDFCFRCFNSGYRHLLCDNTFVYHKESQSFSEEKDKLIEEGIAVLKTKYPEYKSRLDGWCTQAPLTYIGKNISLTMGIKEIRSNILIVIHDWENVEKHVGGTTLHVLDLITSMRNKFNFHIFAPSGDSYKVTSYWKETETVMILDGVVGFSNYNFYNNTYKKMVEKIFVDFKINLVHIHHMIGHYFDLMDIIKSKNIYSMFTMHDFYGACPLINKLYMDRKYCGNASIEKCNECMLRSRNIDSKFIASWREEWAQFYKSLDLIVAPSQNAIDEAKKTYSFIEGKVIEHGIKSTEIKVIENTDDEIFNIAFIGAIGIHKGRDILENLVNSGKLGNVKIHLFGIVDKFNMKNNKHYQNHGKYNREDLEKILKENNIKLICLFSIWPETYSYTLTESISCGIPVIAHNLGAVSERVEKYGFGWIIDVNSSTEEYINKIKKIQLDKKGYDVILNNIRNYKIKSVEEMTMEYNTIYLDNANETEAINCETFYKHFKEERRFVPYFPYGNYEWVFDTFKWKFISKFKLPNFIKRILRKIMGK